MTRTLVNLLAAIATHEAASQHYVNLLNRPSILTSRASIKSAANRVTASYMNLVEAREANDAVIMASVALYVPKANRARRVAA